MWGKLIGAKGTPSSVKENFMLKKEDTHYFAQGGGNLEQ